MRYIIIKKQTRSKIFSYFRIKGQIMVETTDRNYKTGSLYYIAEVLITENYNNDITNSL